MDSINSMKGGSISRIVNLGLKLWLSKKCESIENLNLEIVSQNSEIIRGFIRKVKLHASNVKFQDLRFNSIYIETGELIEWSPFPLFPPYGEMVGKFSKQKDLEIYETRLKDGNIEVNILEP